MKLRLLRERHTETGDRGPDHPDRSILAPKGSRPSLYRARAQSAGRVAGKPGRNPRRRRTRHRLASACRPFRSGGAIPACQKHLPLICQPGDEDKIRSYGFSDVMPLAKVVDWNGVRLQRREGSHGLGPVVQKMGPVMGFQHHGKERTDGLLGRRHRALSGRRNHHRWTQSPRSSSSTLAGRDGTAISSPWMLRRPSRPAVWRLTPW